METLGTYAGNDPLLHQHFRSGRGGNKRVGRNIDKMGGGGKERHTPSDYAIGYCSMLSSYLSHRTTRLSLPLTFFSHSQYTVVKEEGGARL